MSPRQALGAARRLVANYETWTQKCRARDKGGSSCPALAPFAVRWCAEGAVVKVTNALEVGDIAIDMLEAAAQRLFGYSITQVNDSPGGREKALQCFDAAT